MDVDLKLDFKDVLFRPKRSSLKSRSEVGVARGTSSANSRLIRMLGNRTRCVRCCSGEALESTTATHR